MPVPCGRTAQQELGSGALLISPKGMRVGGGEHEEPQQAVGGVG